MKHFLYRISRMLLPFLLLQLVIAVGITLFLGKLSVPALRETSIYVGFAGCALAALLLRGAESSVGLLRNPTVEEDFTSSQRLWHSLMADLSDGRAFAIVLMTSSALLAGSAYLLKSFQ